MVSVSRRRAREAALRVLYEIEVGKANIRDAIEVAVLEMDVTHQLANYMEQLVKETRRLREELDARLSRYLNDYDITRLATIDRNILRIAAYELLYVPEMPPAVTINEAIEIAKRYSTSESGRFINGVLGSLLRDTDKANWDPATAPIEFHEEPAAAFEPEDIEELDVTPDDEKFRAASRVGGWKIRAEEPAG